MVLCTYDATRGVCVYMYMISDKVSEKSKSCFLNHYLSFRTNVEAMAKLEVMLVMLSMTKSPQNEIFNEAYLLRIA